MTPTTCKGRSERIAARRRAPGGNFRFLFIWLRWSLCKVEAGELPTAGEAFTNVELSVGKGGMVPGLAAHLDAAKFGILGAVGGEHDEFAAIGLHEQILSERDGGIVSLAKSVARPHQLAI